MARNNLSIKERILSKIIVNENGCWIWQGDKWSCGYGRMKINYKPKGAHVMSYKVFKGDVPTGLEVCHDPILCDTKSCVNPEHLRVDTHAGNMADKKITGTNKKNNHNARKTHCKYGHKFTEENTFRDTKNGRRCRICVNKQSNMRYYAKKEATRA